MIHCIGNSHAHQFTGAHPAAKTCNRANPYFRSYSIGPTIAYNFIEHHFVKVIEVLKDNNISKDDYIGLVVGEVDCRWHLPKQAELQNRELEDLVKECVSRYFRVFSLLKEFGYKNLICFGVHPTTTDGHRENPDQPVYGDVSTRNKTVKLFNKKLETLCGADIKFVCIYDYLVDENNVTQMEYFNDYCHLNTEKIFPFIIKECLAKGVL